MFFLPTDSGSFTQASKCIVGVDNMVRQEKALPSRQPILQTYTGTTLVCCVTTSVSTGAVTQQEMVVCEREERDSRQAAAVRDE